MTEKKENKKSVTLKITPNANNDYDNFLKKVFLVEKHGKKGVVFETLITQLVKQDPNKVREYLENEKDMINLSDEVIEEYEKKLEESNEKIDEINDKFNEELSNKDKEIEELKKQIEDEKIKHDENLNNIKFKHEKHIAERKTDATNSTKQYETRLEEKNEIINEKDEIIKEKQKTIDQQVQVNKKLQNTMDKMQESMDILNATIDSSNKDVKTARNDYKHIVELHNKTQEKLNVLQNENKEYAVMFAEIRNMSLIDRILRNYPDNIKEITTSKKE